MKKMILLIFMFTVLLRAEKITLASGDWEPYVSEKNPRSGAFTEIVLEIGKELGVEIQLEFYPWKRVELMVQNGSVLAAFPYARNAEREVVYNFSEPVLVSRGYFFYYEPAGRVKIKDWGQLEDLKAYLIGGVLGNWYEKDFLKAGLHVEYKANEELVLQLLQRGLVDLVPGNELVVRTQIKKSFPREEKNFKELIKPTNQSSLHLIFSKKNPAANDWMIKINDALQKIKADGRYKTILSKYGLKE